VRRVFAWLLVGVLVVFVLILAAGVVSNYWVPACQSCHGDVARSVASGSHKAQSCLSCHAGTAAKQVHAFRRSVLFGMILRFYPVSGTKTVADASCKNCHSDQQMDRLLTAQGLHIDHQICAQGGTCVSCHATAGHTLKKNWPARYSMNQCLRCHKQQSVPNTSNCKLCHVRVPSVTAKTTGAASSFALVHGKDWKKNHGLGDQETCSVCHETSFCVSCHGPGFPHDVWTVRTHGRYAKLPDNKCGTCHKDKSYCDGCHGITMPHPADYAQTHAADPKAKAGTVCKKCHVRSDCTVCHNAPAGMAGAAGTAGAARAGVGATATPTTTTTTTPGTTGP